MLDLVAFGEILWDVIDGEVHIGGAPFNLAAHAVRCGLRSATVSCVGTDDLGRTACAEMDRLGVDRRWTAVDRDHPTGTVTVTLAGGQPSYTIHENVAWDFIQPSDEDLQTLAAERPRVFYFGTLAQRSELSRQTLYRLLDRFAFTEVFYDVNLRQAFWSGPQVEAGLARATLVKVNDDEARVLGGLLFDGACAPEDFARAVVARYPVRVVIITLGGEGCLVCERGRAAVRCSGVKVEVVDAVGAGDAFSAAFLAGWLKGATAAEAAAAANRRGAWVASQRGAVPGEGDPPVALMKGIEMSKKVVMCAVIAALGGFLFGFDTVVISGAEKTIQQLWGLSPAMHGLAMGAALWGTVLGSLVGSWPTDRFGRRKTLLCIGALFLVGSLWSAFVNGVYSFMVARFIGGIAIGISTVAAPLYIAEISPPASRGRLAGMFQFNIVFGILVAFLSNYLLARLGDNSWRWMLGIMAAPSIIYTLACLAIPESPRWLIGRKGDRAAAIRVLSLIQPSASAAEIAAKADEIAAFSHDKVSVGHFWSMRLKTPILLAILIAFFNQLSGINAILYFAPRIFELTGLGTKAALLQSVGIGVTNLIFTFVGLWLIDKLGRKQLLTIGSFGYIASLGFCAWAFFSGHMAIVPLCIFAFIAAHAVGQGAVIWVFISEIFPNRHRAGGQSLGSFTHWIFAALLTSFFPSIVTAFAPGYVFLFFCFMMVLQLVWVKFMVPETKGVPLEQMQKKLGIV